MRLSAILDSMCWPEFLGYATFWHVEGWGGAKGNGLEGWDQLKGRYARAGAADGLCEPRTVETWKG